MSRVRVASHVHSDWSYDGRWPLERIGRVFSRLRYDAVLMAEHQKGFDDARWRKYRLACARAGASAGILLVPGIEYNDPANTVHIPVWGDIEFLGEPLPTAELVPLASRAGGICVLAHPGRHAALDKFDPALFDHLTGVELWNRKYDGYAPNQRVAALLRERSDLLPIVSLDFHSGRQLHPLALRIELQQPVTEDAICAALRQRGARATAHGLPATSLANAPASVLLGGAERARRQIAKRIRQARSAARQPLLG
jgi:hypothetical protein